MCVAPHGASLHCMSGCAHSTASSVDIAKCEELLAQVDYGFDDWFNVSYPMRQVAFVLQNILHMYQSGKCCDAEKKLWDMRKHFQDIFDDIPFADRAGKDFFAPITRCGVLALSRF